jgi:hypothetical protein
MSSDLSPIRVLVVDDHQLICVGIGTLLLPESDMKLVGEASNGREAAAFRAGTNTRRLRVPRTTLEYKIKSLRINKCRYRFDAREFSTKF